MQAFFEGNESGAWKRDKEGEENSPEKT